MTTVAELQKRLRVLDDIEEIQKLHYRYVNGLLLSDINEILPCFTGNGVIDVHAGLAKTPDARRAFFEKLLSEHHIGQEGIFMVHPVIDVDGDTATGKWLLYIQFARPRNMVPRPTIFTTDEAPDWMQGYYQTEYARENGEWKVSYMQYRCRLISPLTTLKGFQP